LKGSFCADLVDQAEPLIYPPCGTICGMASHQGDAAIAAAAVLSTLLRGPQASAWSILRVQLCGVATSLLPLVYPPD
jgi:hypothetical protein